MREKKKVMKMRKMLCIAGVTIVLAALAHTATAALPYYLPDSSYVDDDGKSWDGYKMFEDEGIKVMLTFNVYDMQTYSDEVDWVGDIDFGDDRYLYAYQLFNNPNSEKDVVSLDLVDLSGNPIAQFLMHLTQAVAGPANPDDPDAVMPDPNPSAEQGKWIWSPGVGFISAGKYSTFLIFSSGNAPVAGDFRVETEQESEPPTPGDDTVPEPATIVLLGGFAALAALRGNRKNRRA